MPFEDAQWVWKNGKIIPWKDATVHVSAHALHYGSGVFEGMRCYETADGPAIFRLDSHLERFFASAAAHDLRIGYTRKALAEAVCEVIRRNGFPSCYLRPICYVGSGVLSVHPKTSPIEVAVLAWPAETQFGREALQRGVRVTVSPWVRFHSSMMPTTAKACGQYLNSVLAVREAVCRGFDEAVLLDINGYISEGSGENLFLVRSGKLLTNDGRNSILLGITRDSVIRIARDCGYPVEIRTLKVDDLLAADEGFFTGTAAEVTPIREVDGKVIGSGVRGPVTAEIQEAFFAAVSGRDARYRGWLHYVTRASRTSGTLSVDRGRKAD